LKVGESTKRETKRGEGRLRGYRTWPMPTFPTSAAMCSVEKTSDVSPLSFRISIRARGFDDVVTMPAASDRRTKKTLKLHERCVGF
jgi:hypothetical protein